jgi:hypothetical protein
MAAWFANLLHYILDFFRFTDSGFFSQNFSTSCGRNFFSDKNAAIIDGAIARLNELKNEDNAPFKSGNEFILTIK